MEYAIRHAISGRVRLYLPLLYQRSPLTDAVLAFLEGQFWIKGARVNSGCASLVVEYEVTQSKRLGSLMLALRYSTLDDLRAVMAQPSKIVRPGIICSGRRTGTPKRMAVNLCDDEPTPLYAICASERV